jgi:4-hydroxythreonine-4-phosphate dehydrogenase
MMTTLQPFIGIVQGDACGIGPELMSKLLQKLTAAERNRALIISDERIMAAGNAVTGQETHCKRLNEPTEIDPECGQPQLLDIRCLDPANIVPGTVSVDAGRAVLKTFGLAIDLTQSGVIEGICFMPFNKAAMHLAGIGVADELTWAKKRLGVTGRASEFNVIDGMWNARVTSHIPLKDVAEKLNIDGIVDAIVLANQTLTRAGYDNPRIAVAALNPHAGDGGAIGTEEIEIIAPAVEKAKRQSIKVDGPFPSDTLYLKVRDGQFDCAVSMYHDQGQIAIKLLGFDQGVSVLAGLPVPIATPAHGTAFDIVGTNSANVNAALNAFRMVSAMAQGRNLAPLDRV